MVGYKGKPEYQDVGASIILIDDKVVLIHRKESQKFKGGYWNWPGGHRESGESIEECVKREVKNETGLDIKIDKYRGTIIDDKYRLNIHYFLALKTGGELKAGEDAADVGLFGYKDVKTLKMIPKAQEIILREMR